jgi:hypothetical protein
MDPIKSFFKRYHAVPADDVGPTWSKATDEALLGWWNTTGPICRTGWNREAGREATREERAGLMPAYHEVVAELHRRARQPDAPAYIMAAYFLSLQPIRPLD